MARIPPTGTRVVNTKTSIVYVVWSRVVPLLMRLLGPAPARPRRKGYVVIYEVLD
jgi:hypothetical protein